jgi:MFS family permease
MGLYSFMLAGSNFLAPILAGFINDGQGWKWVMYWCAIFQAIGFVFCFFFMEETNYDRAPMEMISSQSTTPGILTPKEPSDPEKTATVADPVVKRTDAGAVEGKFFIRLHQTKDMALDDHFQNQKQPLAR